MPFREPTYPLRLAAVDLGSTSVRMDLVEIQERGERGLLDQLVHPIELGADTFRTNKIQPKTVRALSQVLNNFKQVMKEYAVTQVRVVATSAIRDATNRDMVIDRLQNDCRLPIRVLDAVEEERLTYQQLRPFLRENTTKKNQRSLFLDLGGGSTEIMVIRDGAIALGGSRRLGTARILHSCQLDDCDDSRALLESMIRNSVNSTRELIGDQKFRELVIVNSTLLHLLKGLKGARDLPDGLRIGAGAARKAIQHLNALATEELCQRHGVDLRQAQFIHPALLILREFLNMSRARTVLLTEIDFLDGVINDLCLEAQGLDPQQSFRAEILGSVMGVAQKYAINVEHAQQVATLSMALFEQLKTHLGLQERDRLPLEVAALLHDIGRFISDRDHHKHSMYIIDWSEFVGIGEADRKLISLIARYHRKGRPRESHNEYMRFPPKERMRISKLAALLRIADALDRSHFQQVVKLGTAVTDEALFIQAEAGRELSVEKSALKKKGQLFSDLTGLKIVLERKAI
ncbi:MAG: Ppx/GppA phosphatase family protein [Planctomycetota bacterium]|jgi:exopolyphosphatase/guanosine-5'-triphosphate,3'-diphosphate pyrophosphatase